jgi:hypothetical protein
LGQGSTAKYLALAAGSCLVAQRAEAAAEAGNAHIAHLAVLANAGPNALRAAVLGYAMCADTGRDAAQRATIFTLAVLRAHLRRVLPFAPCSRLSVGRPAAFPNRLRGC